MRAGAAVSRLEDVRGAALDATTRALQQAGLPRAGCVLVGASVEHVDQAVDLCEAVRAAAGSDARIVGAATSAVAVFGDAEQEEGPSLGVLVLESAGEPFSVRLDGRDAAPAVGRPGLGVVFVDPAAPVQRLASSLRRRAPEVQWAGGGAATEGGLFLDDDLSDAHAVGVVLPARGQIAVAQSHQPIGDPMLVTRSEGRSLLELDGKRAVDALSALSTQPAMTEDTLRFLALGVAPEPGVPFRADDFVTVPLLGVDDDQGSLETGVPIAEGTSLAFTLRDGMGARRSLDAALRRLRPSRPAFGVYFDCASRGSALYGIGGLDLGLIQGALGSFPLLSVRTSFEFGPSGSASGVHLFTGVLALGEGDA